MQIHQPETNRASNAFIQNISEIWRHTPTEVVRFATDRGWRVMAEAASEYQDLMAMVNDDDKTLTYYECRLDGHQKLGVIDPRTHYHELIHIMDSELQASPWTARYVKGSNMRAFKRDHAKLSPENIDEHGYFLDADRFDEIPPDGMNAKLFGMLRACDETRAEAGAEFIVDGNGPIMRLMPETTKGVLRDIGRTLPSLLRVSPTYSLR